ncbi:MAG TPA: hypothetical protein GX715_00355 [Armatimonadetes bacterium]|jgi:hypothetical protein|nr:hypothetical protein [Armatimonadota bacterium]
MKHLGTIAAVAGLLLQVGAAHAISFAPPRPIVPTAVEDPSGERTAGLTLGLAAASWDQPDQTIRDSAGTLLGAIEFGTQVRPVITAEYRVNDTWSLGCWYNFVSWDTVLHPVAAPSSVVAADASVDGGIYELHVTRDFPGKNRWDLSAQLGFQHTKYEGSYRVATVGQGIQTQKFEYESQQAVAWGLGTYKIPGARENAPSFGLMGGLGLSQRLKGEGSATQAHLLLGASAAFTPTISATASMWLVDLTDDSLARFTAGVTGRF